MLGKCIFLTTIPFSTFKNYLLTVKIWFVANHGYSILISDNRANKRSCTLSEFWGMAVLKKSCEFIPFLYSLGNAAAESRKLI